ncbi:MAG: hypothetical protein UY90_C0008G0014, partial [Candidatus Peregrinibacteria bacterium GW2011_GWA2_54_9]
MNNQESECNREVVARSDLAQVRRCQVHRNISPRRQCVTAAAYSHSHALLTFLYGGIAESHDVHLGFAADGTYFHRHLFTGKTDSRKGGKLREHRIRGNNCLRVYPRTPCNPVLRLDDCTPLQDTQICMEKDTPR